MSGGARTESREGEAARSGYRLEIDGLRALAIIPVVLFHAGVGGFSGGYLGVDIFFVISGFLITGLLLEERRRTGTIAIGAFYERRVRRIAPALAVAVGSTAVAAWYLVTPARMLEIGHSIVAAFTFSANFWFLSQSHYFATEETFQPLIHVWSLAVEEQFYLGLPVFMFVSRRMPERFVVGILAMLAAASIAASEHLSANDANAAFFRPDTRTWELLAGALCAFVDRRVIPHRDYLAGLGIVLMLASVFVLPSPSYPGIRSLPVCLGTSLVLLSASDRTVVGKALAQPGLVHVGLISYSLYLWHQPILAYARIVNGGALPNSATIALLGLSVALSELSWRFVERPFRRVDWVTRRSVFTFAGVCATVLLGFGLGSNATQGYALRYGDKMASYFEALGRMDDSQDIRTKAIRMGVCHFRADMSPPLDDFLAEWNCIGTGPGAKILVVGDSQGADKAAGFRLNGIDVGQMTGAACSPSPSLMAPECRKLFDFAIAHQAKHATFKTVVIANRNLEPLTDRQISEAIDYWSRLDANILWLSEMPEFAALEDRKAANLLASGSAMAGAFPVSEAAARSNYDVLHRLEDGRYKTIDSATLFCSITSAVDSCLPYIPDEGWIAFAGGHLTAIGARRFAQNLLSDRTLRSTTGL